MRILTAFFLCLGAVGHTQSDQLLTPEQRAYFFHIVRKSPILEQNLGRFLEYTGPQILLTNGNLNYDSVETLIINQPDLLVIRNEEIAKSPKGLLAEAANKMAVTQLNRAIRASNSDEKEWASDRLNYARFLELMEPHLPESAFKDRGEERKLHPKLEPLFNPSLSLDDKKAMMENLKFFTLLEKKQFFDAWNIAVNRFVAEKSYAIYSALGGEAQVFENVLVAAGDGSNTSGLLDEREKDEKGRWNKGLPKAVGLFPYQLLLLEKTNEKGRNSVHLEPARTARIEMTTAMADHQTLLHFDVWGYNSTKQTTVIVEKDGKAYRLFGSGETRFLSPDSSFSAGKTCQSLINDLEFNKIGELKERIYGKKGYDYWIAYNEKKRDETEMQIEKTEKKYSDYGYSAISTRKKVSRKVRKEKKKSKVLRDYQPTTDSQKKTRRRTQQDIVSLYGLFEGYKNKITQLEREKAECMNQMAAYQERLDLMKRNFGLNPVSYTVTDGLYLFADSTRFDLYTQEFTFPAQSDTSLIEIKLLSIGESALSEQSDEVMLHINRTDALPRYDARIQLNLVDFFASDSYRVQQALFTEKDSVALRLFFEALLNKRVDFEVIARGNGIGLTTEQGIIAHPDPIEMAAYPGFTAEEKMTSKMSDKFQNLRRSDIYIHLNRQIVLEVNSYTDPVISQVKVDNADWVAQMDKINLTNNQRLSALRTYALLQQLKAEISLLAGSYLSRADAKIVIDRFNKGVDKARISVGRNSLKL